MRSCSEPNARWTIPTRRLHVCYELAEEFVDLYRDYGVGWTLARARVVPKGRSAASSPHLAQTIGAWKRLCETTSGHRAGR